MVTVFAAVKSFDANIAIIKCEKVKCLILSSSISIQHLDEYVAKVRKHKGEVTNIDNRHCDIYKGILDGRLI